MSAGPNLVSKGIVTSRVLSLSTTQLVDDDPIPAGRRIRVKSNVQAAMLLVPEYLWDGSFQRASSFEPDANGDFDVEGSEIAKGRSHSAYPRGWRVYGDRTLVALNKTSPISGDRDVKIASGAAADQLVQTTIRDVGVQADMVFQFYHRDATAAKQAQWAVVKLKSDGTIEWWDDTAGAWTGGETWNDVAHSITAAKVAVTFSPDEVSRYEPRVRCKTADFNLFVDRFALCDPLVLDASPSIRLTADREEEFFVPVESRLTAIASVAGKLDVIEYGV